MKRSILSTILINKIFFYFSFIFFLCGLALSMGWGGGVGWGINVMNKIYGIRFFFNILLILRSEFLPSNFSDALDILNALDISFSAFFLITSHTLWILRFAFFRSNFSHALDITLCISSRNLYYAHNIIFYIIPNNLKPTLDGFFCLIISPIYLNLFTRIPLLIGIQ